MFMAPLEIERKKKNNNNNNPSGLRPHLRLLKVVAPFLALRTPLDVPMASIPLQKFA